MIFCRHVISALFGSSLKCLRCTGCTSFKTSFESEYFILLNNPVRRAAEGTLEAAAAAGAGGGAAAAEELGAAVGVEAAEELEAAVGARVVGVEAALGLRAAALESPSVKEGLDLRLFGCVVAV